MGEATSRRRVLAGDNGGRFMSLEGSYQNLSIHNIDISQNTTGTGFTFIDISSPSILRISLDQWTISNVTFESFFTLLKLAENVVVTENMDLKNLLVKDSTKIEQSVVFDL